MPASVGNEEVQSIDASSEGVALEDDAPAKPNAESKMKLNPQNNTKRRNTAPRQPTARKRKTDMRCSHGARQSSPRQADNTKEKPKLKLSATALPFATEEPPPNATKRDRRRTPQIPGRTVARSTKERSTKTRCSLRDSPSKKRQPSVAGTSDEQVTRQKMSRAGAAESTTKVLHSPSQVTQDTPKLLARLEGAGAAACKAAAMMAQVAEQATHRADELCAAASVFEGQSPAADLAREAATAVTELRSVAKVAHAFSATAQRTFAVSVSLAVQDRRIFDVL